MRNQSSTVKIGFGVDISKQLWRQGRFQLFSYYLPAHIMTLLQKCMPCNPSIIVWCGSSHASEGHTTNRPLPLGTRLNLRECRPVRCDSPVVDVETSVIRLLIALSTGYPNLVLPLLNANTTTLNGKTRQQRKQTPPLNDQILLLVLSLLHDNVPSMTKHGNNANKPTLNGKHPQHPAPPR